jgi:asparagine synthase (glutamine-hydrolysing)
MCGIAGGMFWGAIAPDRAERAVEAMVQALGHRGPDGRGVSWAAGGPERPGPHVVLGHTRLAIIDTSSAGAQPMGGAGGPSITYNGETFNFLALRRELEAHGARFATATDTEVLLRAYDAWGTDLLPRLRAMFAFGLWDPAARRLLLARDRFGIKPLYYFQGDGFFLFASEVRALLATGLVPLRLDAAALWQYLGYQSIPAPRTLVAGVRMLEPGHSMAVEADGRASIREYWHLLKAAGRHDPPASEADARRRVGDLLRDAVAAHLVSDVPLGAFLSGGIDSSAVVALMREAGVTPRTFSIGFAERAFDESAHAALVARTVGADHTHVELGERDLLDALPAALAAMDQPSGDGVNTFVVAGAVRARGMTVALSGLGGDELFGGYPSFARLARIADVTRAWGRSPAFLRQLAAATVRTIGGASVPAEKAAALIESDGSLSAMFPLTRQVLSGAQRAALMGERLTGALADAADPYAGLLADAFAEAPAAGLYGRISYAEARTYMHDVLLRDTDQMSMAHALEVRVPLLDHPLAEYVAALPDAMKTAAGTPKRLLVEALGGLLPDAVVHRPKQGFTLPFDVWMRGALRPFCEERLGERGLAGRGLLQGAEVGRLWQAFLAGSREVSWSRLWVLVTLDAWLAQVGDFEAEVAA